MKKIFLLIFIATIVACTPDEFPAIGDRNKVVPQLAGTWKLNSVIQRDNDAERKGFPSFAQVQDLSEEFNYTNFELTLNADDSGNPTTFSIETNGAPNIIGEITSGNWVVDDVNYPSTILFGTGDVSIELGSFAGLQNGQMVFKLIRYQPKGENLESVVTYQYTFIKD